MLMVIEAIFFISLSGIVFLFLNKWREIEMGKAYVRVSVEKDTRLKQRIDEFKVRVQSMPREAFHAAAFFTIKHAIAVFDRTKHRIYPRVSHIVDALKGRDIPRNRGSVSLFLKYIEERREDK